MSVHSALWGDGRRAHTSSLMHRSEVPFEREILARDFELWEPLQSSFRKTPLAAHFSDTEWATKLAYLCDICNLLSELDLSLQGRMITVFKSADKVAAFKAKLELWGVNTGIFDMFQTLAEILKRLSQGFLPPSWCMITCLSSQKTHLWISQVNWLCPC